MNEDINNANSEPIEIRIIMTLDSATRDAIADLIDELYKLNVQLPKLNSNLMNIDYN